MIDPTASSFGVGLHRNQPKEGERQNGSNAREDT